MPGHRLEREQERDEPGADAGGGAQPPEADRTDAEPVLGDGGQQRDRTAEQHRDEVERDRAEQHRFAAHEAQTFHRVAQALAPGARHHDSLSGLADGDRPQLGLDRLHAHRLGRAAIDGLDERDRDRGDDEQARGDQIGEPHVDDVEEATQDGPWIAAACQLIDWRATSQAACSGRDGVGGERGRAGPGRRTCAVPRTPSDQEEDRQRRGAGRRRHSPRA